MASMSVMVNVLEPDPCTKEKEPELSRLELRPGCDTICVLAAQENPKGDDSWRLLFPSYTW